MRESESGTGDHRTPTRASGRPQGCRCCDPCSQTSVPPATSASERTRTSGEKIQLAVMRAGVRSTRTKPWPMPSRYFRCGNATRTAAAIWLPSLPENCSGVGELMAGVTSSTAIDPPRAVRIAGEDREIADLLALDEVEDARPLRRIAVPHVVVGDARPWQRNGREDHLLTEQRPRGAGALRRTQLIEHPRFLRRPHQRP